MAQVRDTDQITRDLAELDGWSGDTTALRRTIQAHDFPSAIRLVDEVAVVAEELNHHPDIDIRWRTLHFTLSTHSAGGVTEFDITLARRIDTIARRFI
jgi:4a-hydroxytetrahydrobiopterin dehydratase